MPTLAVGMFCWMTATDPGPQASAVGTRPTSESRKSPCNLH